MMLTTRSRQVAELVRDRGAAQVRNREEMKRRHSEPHNPAYAVLADGAWRDEPCFLIGGGPSLVGFDFERLRGKGRIVAINRAYEFVPFADVLFFMDNKFYKRCHEPKNLATWQGFNGYKVFLDLMGRKYDDCYHLRSVGRTGLSGSLRRGLYHGNNSGVGALNFALVMGAKPIYLLGYDCRYQGKVSHFHDGYGPTRTPEGIVRSFVRDFDRMAKHIKDRGRIYNLNPNSKLTVFQFSTIDEVLGGETGQGVGDDASVVRQAELQPTSA